MLQVRRRIFETNSSSVHSITICNDRATREIPKKVHFHVGEFGWEERYLSPEERADYLWTAVYARCRRWTEPYTENLNDWKAYLKGSLQRVGCEAVFNEPSDNYFVDHDEGLFGFLDWIKDSPINLFNYLFNTKTVVYLNNDDGGDFSDGDAAAEFLRRGGEKDICFIKDNTYDDEDLTVDSSRQWPIVKQKIHSIPFNRKET